MQTIVHQQQDILKELQAISSALKKSNPQVRRKSRVNELVGLLLMQNPHRSWTAAAMGREIGATGQAVGRCAVWKEYRKVQEQVKDANFQVKRTLGKEKRQESND